MIPIIDFFVHFFDYVLAAFSYIYEWLCDLISESVTSFLEAVADVLPDLSPYWEMISDLSEYFPVINYFFPLYEAGYFISIYFSFLTLFLVTKYVIKIFIPFVG